MRGLWLLTCLVMSSPALGFEGSYSAESGGTWQKAEITKRSNDLYAVELSVGRRGCMGDLEAVGKAAGDVLRVDKDDAIESCHLVVTKKNGGIEIKESRCNSHGGACSFNGFYAAAGAAKAPKAAVAPTPTTTPTVAPTPSLVGRFYCGDEARLDMARVRDPNYRLKPPAPGADVRMSYDFFYHEGLFGYSDGGDTTSYRDVKVTVAGSTASYVSARGQRWTVSPVGASKVTIRGTGLPQGATAYACFWR